jgi:hypothetical protein
VSVVVGYVSTPEGDAALAAAVEEARSREAQLIVILRERGHPSDAEMSGLGGQVDGLRARLDGTGLRYDVRLTTRGRNVADDIIGAATSENGVLIVIGLRRRSPVSKLLLGSNAQRILLDAPCPVLAVKSATL